MGGISERSSIIRYCIIWRCLTFMGIWAIWSPLKIHCYTCMSFKTCWSRLIYTKLSSHRSFVINTYVIKMAWRCIFPWSFHRSLQRRREIDIFHTCQQISAFWNKNNKNMRGFERMLSYEQYPEEKSHLWLSSFKKNWSTFMEDYST